MTSLRQHVASTFKHLASLHEQMLAERLDLSDCIDMVRGLLDCLDYNFDVIAEPSRGRQRVTTSP